MLNMPEMRAIINKLPVDAKGNPVVPCVDKVWIVGNDYKGWMSPDMYIEPGLYEMSVLAAYNKTEWLLIRYEGGKFDLWDDGEWWDGPVYLNKSDAEEAMKENK